MHWKQFHKFNTGENSKFYVDPGTFRLGPGSKVEIAEGSVLKVYGNVSEDSLLLHDNAVLQISTGARVIVGNSSALAVLPGKTLSIGESSKLSIADHVHCVVTTDVGIAEYTKVEIGSSQADPGGLSCVPKFSDGIRQSESFGLLWVLALCIYLPYISHESME